MTNMQEKNNIMNIIFIVIIIILTTVIWVLAYKLWVSEAKVNSNNNEKSQLNNDWESDNEFTSKQGNKSDISITVIWDERCDDCDTELILEQLKSFPWFQESNFIEYDFKDEEAKELMTKNEINNLPAFIFSSKDLDDNWQISPYLKETSDWLFSLDVWASFDPYSEICWNWVDDDSNWLIDCEDDACKKELTCAPKVAKPKAELFIMSYCPFGTQAEKGFLEAMLKLKDHADMKVRFVHYLMHGKEEWEQNITQYCIQKEQNDKYTSYLQCFLKGTDWIQNEQGRVDYSVAQEYSKTCIKEALIDEKILNSCEESTKESIDFENALADSSKRFPDFNLDKEDATNYWVQGSPSFVLNGIKVEKVWRSEKAYADLICDSFETKPEICNEEFSNTTYDPNFGITSNGQVIEWGCGG